MRVVVTGASGNLGVALLRHLPLAVPGTEVVGVCRRRPAWSPPHVRWVPADVRHDDLQGLMQDADAVVHLAWSFQPTHDPVRTFDSNVIGSLRVFDAALAAQVPCLVHLSSIGAYAPGPVDRRPVDETWPTHALPTAAYGREKSYLERVLDHRAATHPATRIVRLRPGFVFQPDAATEQRRLFAGPLLPGRLLEHVPAVPHLPNFRFQVLHADDVAAAVAAALQSQAAGAFNLAAEPVLGTADLAAALDARPVRVPAGALRRAVGAAWRAHLVPASPGLLELVLSLPQMDSGRARRELAWQPRYPAGQVLRDHLAALAAQQRGPTPPLSGAAGGAARWRELASGVGGREEVDPDLASPWATGGDGRRFEPSLGQLPGPPG